MKRLLLLTLCILYLMSSGNSWGANQVDRQLAVENKQLEVAVAPVPVVDDLAFLRRASVDLIGRIPSTEETQQYLAWPQESRRQQLVDKLLQEERFADRWTAFFGDALRLRSNVTGGGALTAYVHRALKEGMPYDELSRRLIATNGKANKTPEVGFILGDNADPLALASATSQVFLGVRIGCAQCHDHPFDVWTRKDFYGMAAFFGKTRRVESRLTNVVFTTEANATQILWPPQDEAESGREPMMPRFPFQLRSKKEMAAVLARLTQKRQEREQEQEKSPDATVDDLINSTASKAARQTQGVETDPLGVTSEAKRDIRKIDIQASLYRHSEWRSQLADLVTDPRNPYFSQALVNRVWKELVGRGFVEPVDDFRQDNPASHPETLAAIADEFVASGFEFRELVRLIVLSDVYQRQHAPAHLDELTRSEMEASFLATPMRRMLAEALYDSVVTAGHLFEYKYPEGHNSKIVEERVRVFVPEEGSDEGSPEKGVATLLADNQGDAQSGTTMMARNMAAPSGYQLETAIELNFDELLNDKDDVEIAGEKMRAMSREEVEAQRMMKQNPDRGRKGKYVTKYIERQIDDNPKFNSAFRMAAPAPAGHFVRIFGQTPRTDLGEQREQDPSMRQALMMLNGRLTHEASRVGPFEPMHQLLAKAEPQLDQAVKLAYLEILTRRPTAEEMTEAKSIVLSASDPLQGMADLRWVLLNCNEFCFLP